MNKWRKDEIDFRFLFSTGLSKKHSGHSAVLFEFVEVVELTSLQVILKATSIYFNSFRFWVFVSLVAFSAGRFHFTLK